METLRTPDERFANLPGYSFEPHYTEVSDGEGGKLRIHHVEQGPSSGEVVLCLHGQPTWSYLYRTMIPIFAQAGYRTIAPDFVGFGRSDKPTRVEDYTYARHVSWMRQWLQANELHEITLVCQDWGGLIGLRLVATLPEHFSRVVIANTGLPEGAGFLTSYDLRLAPEMNRVYSSLPVPADLDEVFEKIMDPGEVPPFFFWRKFVAQSPNFRPQDFVKKASNSELSADVLAAYDAPFPDESFLAGPRRFPSLVPITPDDPEATTNKMAWKVLEKFAKPFLTAFSDGDAGSAGMEIEFQERVPGAKKQTHVTIKNAGHFLQEDAGSRFAEEVVKFMRSN
jgi:haloalkane dehalogenase